MKKLYLRLKADIPAFWKQVRKLFAYFGVVFIAILTISTTIHIPVAILTVCSYGVAVCIAVCGTASFTVKNQSDIEPPDPSQSKV